ncbi:TPA: hypothetical protein RPW15_001678 [Campylobacter fetus subsp. venerealis]|uniref:Uncharacterized protein n=1 Tax=Campylobacter fetus subsp. venerealis NCTC 10354 TaxID=983328 RepID=A0AAE6M965_CAMFE|nr:hypothetical protein [Campylobacter fetus]OCS25439.1 hypothetical protein CFVB10_08560 [Campylobacter fetus subsp. venerealis cfvB10]OCS29084.1 hypothetical protein CFVCCUG33900_08260 [Campylobacter fetus subsp. venerealis LMG 6570 = CCUG 33900]AIR80145.1 hypothetical protein CFV97608_0482 [Campylobacter fetus subsp. venerealis 97/608]EAK0836138.1 hypothetical protein [Campylobacter fetus]EGU23669.1 Hypothetical protein CFV354_0585 [Campylobacter fetus subsp. venerealis NCTC 10354]
MNEINVADVREFFSLNGLSDAEITPHLNSAINKFSTKQMAQWDYKEAVCCQTIANCATLLFSKGMNNLESLETIYQGFGDINAFKNLWEDRANALLHKNESAIGAFYWASV